MPAMSLPGEHLAYTGHSQPHAELERVHHLAVAMPLGVRDFEHSPYVVISQRHVPRTDGYAMPTHAGRRRSHFVSALLLLFVAANPALAQIPAGEYAARRDSLAARVRNGIVVAFGARTPVTDFGPFYQLPA